MLPRSDTRQVIGGSFLDVPDIDCIKRAFVTSRRHHRAATMRRSWPTTSARNYWAGRATASRQLRPAAASPYPLETAVASALDQNVAAGTAIKNIDAGPADQHVVAGTPRQCVIPCTSDQDVVTVAAILG